MKIIRSHINSGGIFYSSNGGSSWSKSNAQDKNWRGVSSSFNGLYLAAITEGQAPFTYYYYNQYYYDYYDYYDYDYGCDCYNNNNDINVYVRAT